MLVPTRINKMRLGVLILPSTSHRWDSPPYSADFTEQRAKLQYVALLGTWSLYAASLFPVAQRQLKQHPNSLVMRLSVQVP